MKFFLFKVRHQKPKHGFYTLLSENNLWCHNGWHWHTDITLSIRHIGIPTLFHPHPFFVKQINYLFLYSGGPKYGIFLVSRYLTQNIMYFRPRLYSYNLNYCTVNLKSCQEEESYRTNKNAKSIHLNTSRFFSKVYYHFVIAFAFTKSWKERKHDQKYNKLSKITCNNKSFDYSLYPCICIRQLTHPWHLSDPVLHQI